jgi:hypothetical protein
MRYIVKVECLSSVVLAKLKKSSRILHIFSLIDNTIALETEDIGYIKGLKEVRQVYESGKAKLILTDALNKIGILTCRIKICLWMTPRFGGRIFQGRRMCWGGSRWLGWGMGWKGL